MRSEIGFWDTSALLPLCCARSGPASRSRALFRRFQKPVLWWATQVEVRSALSRLREERELSVPAYISAIKRWEALEAVGREINPTEQVRKLARGLPEQYRLRTLDAFQLAAALVWTQERPRRRPFICFDDRLATAAETAGFDVHRLESPEALF